MGRRTYMPGGTRTQTPPPPLVEYVQYVVVAQVKRSITDGERSLRPSPFFPFSLERMMLSNKK
jgi:hypothetical protein